MHEASGVGYGLGEFRLPFDSIFDSIFDLVVVCCFDVVNFDFGPPFRLQKGKHLELLAKSKAKPDGLRASY